MFRIIAESSSGLVSLFNRLSTELNDKGTLFGINAFILIIAVLLIFLLIGMAVSKIVSTGARIAAAVAAGILFIILGSYVSLPEEVEQIRADAAAVVNTAVPGGDPLPGEDKADATYSGSYEFVAFANTIEPADALVLMEGMPSFEYDYNCTDHYEREDWKHWSTASKFTNDVAPNSSSINTRHNELYRESLIDITLSDSRRSVVAGEWQLVYTEGTTTNPQDLDAEHVVPLGNANCIMYSMGLNFDSDTREQLANDVDLVFMAEKGENRARGAASWADSPYGDGWFPSNPASHCGWISLQLQMRDKYGLGVTPDERSIATGVLEGCVQ